MPKKKPIKTRDYNMVKVINGATKAGVHVDRKKEANKKFARQRTNIGKPNCCIQCGFPITVCDEMEDYEQDGFCSESCYDYHTEHPNE